MDSYTVHDMGANEPTTMMEIAKFPHWENVFSNILEFLLDTEQVHGFGPLFIRSIMAIYSSRCPDGWPKKGLDPESVQATEKVERETSTATNNRIDILIECEDFVVCIENKIWSGLHNDLGEYREHCKTRCDGNPNAWWASSSARTASPIRAFKPIALSTSPIVTSLMKCVGAWAATSALTTLNTSICSSIFWCRPSAFQGPIPCPMTNGSSSNSGEKRREDQQHPVDVRCSEA